MSQLQNLKKWIMEVIAKPKKLTIDSGQLTMAGAACAAPLLVLLSTWTSCLIAFALPFLGFATGSMDKDRLVQLWASVRTWLA
jgi:hypothetical protein